MLVGYIQLKITDQLMVRIRYTSDNQETAFLELAEFSIPDLYNI
jgi:hypothetical protein